jgi:hypothetical protein
MHVRERRNGRTQLGVARSAGVGKHPNVSNAFDLKPNKRTQKKNTIACAHPRTDIAETIHTTCFLCDDSEVAISSVSTTCEQGLHDNFSKKKIVKIRDSIMVSISACHAEDPGSIPGRGISSYPDACDVNFQATHICIVFPFIKNRGS